MNNAKERLYNGIIKENPTFVMMLGMCPTLAVTTSAVNGMGMGLTTTAVLILSNVMIAMLRNVIPERIRIPSYIVLIATVVTVVELLLKGFIPFLYDSLGIYIPLIVVNCIILGRAEAYASKNSVFNSLFDGIGMGVGFTFALTCIGALRELIGTGKIFDFQVMPDGYVPVSIFILAPGAFFVLALLTAIQNKVKIVGNKRGKNMEIIQSGCNLDCMECGEGGCSKRVFGTEDKAEDSELIIQSVDDIDEEGGTK
ncbi:MAG: electron transport complex subunit E [Clostridiales bacterium]|nr:electron transport complex subunit E [Clostridiales bacterium]